MLDLKKVAITGGLSCGKSSVCRILQELGAYTLSADDIVHHLLSSSAAIEKEIVQLLGSDILVNHKIDRSQVAHLVFQDADKLKKLEELIHPLVYREIERRYLEQQNQPMPPLLFVVEIPLLFESRGQKKFDITVAVLADEQICLERFTKKNNCSKQEYLNRMARQIPMIDKERMADYIITNNGTLSSLRLATESLYTKITS